jgi:hypothetical protein
MTATTTKTPAPEIVVAEAPETSLVHADTSRSISRMKRSLADYERGIAHYPEAIRTRVRWLLGYWLDQCSGSQASLRAIACKAGWDKSEEYYYNLLGGYYFKGAATQWKEDGKAWGEFLEIYECVRRYADQAARQGRMAFVETPTFRCISQFIDAGRALNAVCRVRGITGPTGGQKTAALKQYATLNNHGAVIRIEAPACPRVGVLQRKIADRYHIPASRLIYNATREAAIREQVNETRCIIIDNAQRLYVPGKGSDQPCFNWLLELQEDTECSLILSFTTDFTDVLTAGRAKGYFEQFVGRMGGMQDLLRLPDYTPAADLRAIARAFGLTDGKTAMDYLHRWSREDGRIRIVFSRLQRAKEFAKLDGRERITLSDLEEARTWTPPAIGTDSDEET